MKEFKIEVPKGFEIDKEKSTFEKIVFKEIKDSKQKLFEYHKTTEEEFNKLYENLPKHVKAYALEVMVVEYYNKGWTPNWSNSSEYKYCPWLYLNNFRLCTVDNCCTGSSCSARLCFKSEEDCREAVEEFFEVFKESRMLNYTPQY